LKQITDFGFAIKDLPFSLFAPLREIIVDNVKEPLIGMFVVSFGLAFFTNRKFMHARWYLLVLFTFIYYFALRYILQI